MREKHVLPISLNNVDKNKKQKQNYASKYSETVTIYLITSSLNPLLVNALLHCSTQIDTYYRLQC